MLSKTKATLHKTVGSSRAIERKGELFALGLFKEAARRVPAYRHFLEHHAINPERITTIADLGSVPPIDKANYLTQYSLSELSWDGDLFKSRIISVSSGSTGSSFFWPRGAEQDAEGVWMHEQLFKEVYQIDRYQTLVIVCFSMGTWIAGSFTTASALGLADKGYPLNVVTPGIERDEAVKVITKLASNYEQIILTGYPPFLKDVIEQAIRTGFDWSKHRTRLLFAGEAFSEEWRDHLLGLIKAQDGYHYSANVYGTADAAMVGHETPVSIAARKIYNRHSELAAASFGTPVLPSIVQYYPDRRYIETVDGELVFTARAGIPLVRYNIHDTGGVISYANLLQPIRDEWQDEISRNTIATKPWRLPFVFLNGRKDFTATIYAVNIYPENIKAALLAPSIHSWVTGRFTMATKYRGNMNQYFEINIELAPGISARTVDRRRVTIEVVDTLRRLNAEYHKLYQAVGTRAKPRIHLIAYGDQKYFGNGVKHTWIHDSGPR